MLVESTFLSKSWIVDYLDIHQLIVSHRKPLVLIHTFRLSNAHFLFIRPVNTLYVELVSAGSISMTVYAAHNDV
jgi:hypothetical protein